MGVVIPQLERQAGGTVVDTPRVAIPTPDLGVGARLLGELGQNITSFSQKVIAAEERETAEAERFRLKEQDETDNIMATRAYNEYLNTTIVQDDSLLNRTGFDAKDISTDMTGLITPEYKRLKDALENDQQRLLFEKVSAGHALSRKSKYNQYERAEMQKSRQRDATAILESAERAAIDDYNNPNTFKNSKKDINIFTEKAMPGAGPEEIKNAKEKMISDIHVGRVNAYISENDVSGATAYFNGISDEIVAEQRDDVNTLITIKTNDRDAFVLAEDIIGVGGTPTEQRDKAKAAPDDLRKETIRLVDVDIQHEQAIIREQDNTAREDITLRWENALSVKSGSDIIKEIDTNKYIINKGTFKSRMNKLQTSRIKANNGGKVVTTTEGLLDKYSVMDLIDTTNITRTDITVALKGNNSVADLEEVLEYHKQGGIIGNIKESTLRSLYEKQTGAKIEGDDAIMEYMDVRKFIIDHISSTGKYNENEVVNIISSAIIRTPKTGFIGFREPGTTLATAVAEGTLDQFIEELEVPEEPSDPFNKTRIINKLVAENKRRSGTGENLLIVDDLAVKEYYIRNKLGLTRVIDTTVEPTLPALQAPAPTAAPTPPTTEAPTIPTEETKAAELPKILRSSIKKITEAEGKTDEEKQAEIDALVEFSLAKPEPKLSEKEQVQEAVSKYPKELRAQIAGIITNKDITSVVKERLINNLLRVSGFTVTEGE